MQTGALYGTKGKAHMLALRVDVRDCCFGLLYNVDEWTVIATFMFAMRFPLNHDKCFFVALFKPLGQVWQSFSS